jgi:hypothetical protein
MNPLDIWQESLSGGSAHCGHNTRALSGIRTHDLSFRTVQDLRSRGHWDSVYKYVPLLTSFLLFATFESRNDNFLN